MERRTKQIAAERPCTRCVKKGMAQQCVEGVRKKAKYLLEEDEKSEFELYQSLVTSLNPVSEG